MRLLKPLRRGENLVMLKTSEPILIDPEIAHGRPVIKGTRVPVDVILGALAGGMEMQEVAS